MVTKIVRNVANLFAAMTSKSPKVPDLVRLCIHNVRGVPAFSGPPELFVEGIPHVIRIRSSRGRKPFSQYWIAGRLRIPGPRSDVRYFDAQLCVVDIHWRSMCKAGSLRSVAQAMLYSDAYSGSSTGHLVSVSVHPKTLHAARELSMKDAGERVRPPAKPPFTHKKIAHAAGKAA